MPLPNCLKLGDHVRVLGLSRSLGGVFASGSLGESDAAYAVRQLEAFGLKVTLGRHVHDCNEHLLAPAEARLSDLHEALKDDSVKAILAVTGGAGASQLLDGIDYDLVRKNPKIFCGYSDCAFVFNAILAKTGLVTYYGPNFTSFMAHQGIDYTRDAFKEMLFHNHPVVWRPSDRWSDDNWAKEQTKRTFIDNDGYWPIQNGQASGVAVGGNYWCLNMLQGTDYFPSLDDSILFMESPGEGKASLISLDGALRSLSFQKGFSGVRGIVLGRYPRSSGVSREDLRRLFADFPAVAHIPVVANSDFGHTTPMMPIPLGANCSLKVQDNTAEIVLRIASH